MKKNVILAVLIGITSSIVMPITGYATEVDKENININQEKLTQEQAIEGEVQKEAVVKEEAFIEKSVSDEFLKKYPKLINPEKKDMVHVQYKENTLKMINDLLVEVENLEKNHNTNTEKEYIAVLEKLLAIHSSMDLNERKNHNQNDQLSYIFYKTNFLAFYKFKGTEEHSKIYDKIADMLYLERLKSYNDKKELPFVQEFLYYLNSLTIYRENVDGKEVGIYFDWNTSITINVATSLSYFIDLDNAEGKDIPETKPSEQPKPDFSNPLKPDYDPNEIDKNFPLPPKLPNYGDDGFNENGTYTLTEYIKENNGCYLVDTTYNYSHEAISNKKIKLAKQSEFLCGLGGIGYDGIYSNGAFILQGQMSHNIWNSLKDNELNLSSNTIQYTINATDKVPYYFDTGIRTSMNNTVTYTQLKDTLKKIAYKTKGAVIEDKNKALFVANGVPLVLMDRKDEYSKEEVENLLDGFKDIDLKIAQKQQNQTQALNEKENLADLENIKIKDKDYKLKNKAIIKNSILQLPIEEVSKLLGFKVKSDDKFITLTKGKENIKIEIGTNKISINDEEKLTTSKYEKNNDNVVYGDMNLIIKSLDMNLEYLEKEKQIIINAIS